MVTNLPVKTDQTSDRASRLFFDSYGLAPLEFNATEVDAAVTFFRAQGFADEAATVVSATLLKQAKLDNIPIFQILDNLKTFDGLQLSLLIGEILNNNRVPTSTLGFKTERIVNNQTRNVAA